MSELDQEEIRRRREEMDKETARRMNSCFWRQFTGPFTLETVEDILGVKRDEPEVKPAEVVVGEALSSEATIE